LFLKPFLEIKSEHGFQDTVEEHGFPRFSADASPEHSRSQFQGFENTATCRIRMRWNIAGYPSPKITLKS
jgi:hypothetical protein